MSSAHIWWFVSDLHLGASPDHRGTAAALVEFLGVVAGTRPETERSIVMLGDSFDLPADDSAAAALSAIARRHPEVFSALTRARSVGVDIEVVCGNHDTALARPAVREALGQLLSVGVAARSARPAVRCTSIHGGCTSRTCSTPSTGTSTTTSTASPPCWSSPCRRRQLSHS